MPVINYSVQRCGDSIAFDLQIPGPGEYAVKIQKTIGAKMSVSPIVTDVDLAMRRASKIPGPGAYDDLYGKKMSGGRFSTAKPKSDVDWIMYRSARIPGPGEYEIKSPTPSGGRIGTKAPTALDQLIAYNKKLPGPGFYDNDIYSIGKRTGAVPIFSSSVPASKPATPHSTALYGGIPPEARRKPAPKNEDSLESLTNGQRPHTSLGLMRERDGSQEKLPDNGTVEAEKTKKKNSRPWYRKGVSRDDSFRGASPGKWMVPESAQRAYGVWGDDVSTHKKRKSRRKALDDPDTSKPFLIPRSRHVTVRMNAGNHDIEAFFNEDCDASETQAADLRHGHKKGQKLSPEAQKLYDLATQVLGGSCLLVCVCVCYSQKVSEICLNFLFSSIRLPHLLLLCLFPISGQSEEFRKMMQMFTGMDDPSAIIEKYVEIWAKQPLDSSQAAPQRRTRSKAAQVYSHSNCSVICAFLGAAGQVHQVLPT